MTDPPLAALRPAQRRERRRTKDTRMKPATRLLLAPALLALMAATADAQPEKFSGKAVFAFAPKPFVNAAADPVKDFGATLDINVRPNQANEFYLFAYNPEAIEKTYVVDLKGTDPAVKVAAQSKAITIPAESWVRVRLEKPAPAVPPVVVVPAAPPGAAPPTPEPVPPGTQLTQPDDKFQFTLRLLQEDGKPAVSKADKLPYGRNVTVSVMRPNEYLAAPVGKISRGEGVSRVTLSVSPKFLKDEPAFTGAADVRLTFPAHFLARGTIVREGFYRRTLEVTSKADPKALPIATLVGAVENAKDEVVVHVGADGFDRGFIYHPEPAAATKDGNLIRDEKLRVRLYPAVGYATTAATQPIAGFPVRIETDNAPRGSRLEVWLRPAGTIDPNKTEVVRLGGPHEERVWLDPAGPTDQGLLVTNKLRDWVKPLDVAALRGRQEVIAVLTAPDGKEEKSAPLALTVDASAPDKVEFAPLPAKHVKGTPLPVKVSAVDTETRIVKAVFFLGKPTDDGKLPADAVKVDGVPWPRPTTALSRLVGFSRYAESGGVLAAGIAPASWVGEVPLPPEKRGEAFVGVQFTNDVGLVQMKTQRIVLVDPPIAAGSVVGFVKVGGVPQAGLTVALRAADGKELATTKTNEKGKFTFESVFPGAYTVASSKPSSSYPFAGSAPVQVAETDKPPEPVTVNLTKQVK